MTKSKQESKQRCDFGWVPSGPADPSLVAEVTYDQRYGAGRAWSAAAAYTLMPSPKRIYLVYTVEGGFDFTVDGKVETTRPGQLVLLDGVAVTSARTRTETARFVWHFDPTFLSPARSRFAFHEPISVGNSSMRALTSVTNSLLNASPVKATIAHAHMGLAIEHLVAGALSESGPLPQESDAVHQDGVFMTANLVIEARFRDPGFGVAQLERELSVGSSTLHDAFQAFATTPRREIERRRVNEVMRTKAQMLTFAEIIEQAGFASDRQYRRALSRRPSVHGVGDEG